MVVGMKVAGMAGGQATLHRQLQEGCPECLASTFLASVNTHVLEQESAGFLCEGPGSKEFRNYRTGRVCIPYSLFVPLKM